MIIKLYTPIARRCERKKLALPRTTWKMGFNSTPTNMGINNKVITISNADMVISPFALFCSLAQYTRENSSSFM